MSTKDLSRTLACAMLAFVACHVPAQADDAAELVRAGRALYRGEVAFAQAPTVQGVPLPGGACLGCHGARGEARREASVAIPAIHSQALRQQRDAQPGLTDDDALLRALEDGVGRASRPLQAPMPRYAFTQTERHALLAYLRVLATDADPVPGVEAERIFVASVLPLSGPQAAIGEHIRAALAARFDAVNAAGGVFGRRIELRAVDSGPAPASASTATMAVLRGPGEVPFAFVGSLLADPDTTLRDALKAMDVPMVATLGVPARDAAQPQITYLLPSLASQLRQLVASLARRCGTPDGAALVLHPPGARLADELASSLPTLHWRSVADESAVASALKSAPMLPVIALLPPARVAQVRTQLQRRDAPACLGTLAVVTGPESDSSPGRTLGVRTSHDLVALPMPPLVDDPIQAPGAALWLTLGDTAARVFVEALARSGRQVDAARFASALDTLHRFEPVAGLSVTFSPTKRHGFDVATLSRENSYAKAFR